MSAYTIPNTPNRIGLRKLLRCIRRERADPALHCILPVTVAEFRKRWPDRAPDGARL